MFLFREKINDWQNFVNEKISGVYPYLYNDTLLTGWLDISTIENNDNFGFRAADYVRATKEIWLLFDAKPGTTETAKWQNCDTTEKTILARRHIIIDKALRLEIFTIEEDKQNFYIHAEESIDTRSKRVLVATPVIGYELNTNDRKDLFSDISLKITAFVEANDPDLQNYMYSIGPYIGGGFKAKSYYSDEILNLYKTIVLDGIY